MCIALRSQQFDSELKHERGGRNPADLVNMSTFETNIQNPVIKLNIYQQRRI